MREIVRRRERLRCFDSLSGDLAQSFDESHAEAYAAVFPATAPGRMIHIDRKDFDAVALRIFHERRRMIKTHWPRIHQRDIKRGRMTRFEIRARVCDEREARRVRLRESIQRE